MLRENTVVTRAVVPAVAADGWDALLDHAVSTGSLHPLEASFARSLPAPRRATFVAGRQALREAVMRNRALGNSDLGKGAVGERGWGNGAVGERGWGNSEPILRTHRGAPALPAAITGSVSHKRTLAIAAVAPRVGSLQHLGLDLEQRPTADDLRRPSIARKILTAREYAQVEARGVDTLEGRELVLVHFALKEAVYKAIDPFVERYVRFTEVELEVSDADDVQVTLHLPEEAVAAVRVQAGFQLDGEWIVAAAYSHR
jgi:4'-phosphopantetheinyl transferase EntD